MKPDEPFELMIPLVEQAENFREMLKARGWSEVVAEAEAAEFMVGVMRMAFAEHTAEIEKRKKSPFETLKDELERLGKSMETLHKIEKKLND